MSTGDVEDDLAELGSRRESCVGRVDVFQRERLFDGNPQASSRDVRQDVALDEAGGDGLGLERASPQAWSRGYAHADP